MNVSRETIDKEKLSDKKELKMLREFLTQYHKQDECVSISEWAIFTIEDLDQKIDELTIYSERF